MTLYRRGTIWWYQFEFHGALIRESTGLTNKEAARTVEDTRKGKLKNANAGVTARVRVPIFEMAANQYLKAKRQDWAANTYVIESTNLTHLKSVFAGRLLSDIDHNDVADYRDSRINQEASAKTISLELGTLRAIMIYHDLDATWTAIKKKIKLAKAEKMGRAITADEEAALLRECRNSRSRSLPVAVITALESCMRYSELRLLRWQQIDLGTRTITVSKSKTDAGEGRAIPMSRRLYETLVLWSQKFPDRKLNHFVFPAEKYGQNGAVYAIDATRPIGTWKYAWKDARKRSGVECRFHDLRHTGCTRLLDAGTSHPMVAELMGWSTSTAIRMIKEVYGHISLDAKRRAVERAENFRSPSGYAQNPTQSQATENVTIQ